MHLAITTIERGKSNGHPYFAERKAQRSEIAKTWGDSEGSTFNHCALWLWLYFGIENRLESACLGVERVVGRFLQRFRWEWLRAGAGRNKAWFSYGTTLDLRSREDKFQQKDKMHRKE